MSPVFVALLALLASTFQTRAAQQAEIAALRHQIAVLQRSSPCRLCLKQADRLLWILLSRLWPGWRRWVYIVKPDTVIRWHRRAFARYWTWKSRRRPGRPAVAAAIRDLIQRMSRPQKSLNSTDRVFGHYGILAASALGFAAFHHPLEKPLCRSTPVVEIPALNPESVASRSRIAVGWSRRGLLINGLDTKLFLR